MSHQRETMSYNEIYASHDAKNLAIYGARKHQGFHPTQRPTQPKAGSPSMMGLSSSSSYRKQTQSLRNVNANANHHQPRQYVHGRKASLAGFDPFSSEASSAVPVVEKNASANSFRNLAAAYNNESNMSPVAVSASTSRHSPIGRDSSPSGWDASGENTNNQRQPPTPPKAEREIFEAIKSSTAEDLAIGKDSKKTSATPTKNGQKNPMKKVNKFLRKSAIVKSLSLGQISPGSSSNAKKHKGHQDKKSPSATVSASKDPRDSPVAVAKEGHNNQVGQQSQDTAATATVLKANTSMAQDLLELKDQFGGLQIPSLGIKTKTSPTSFLTGKGDEAVRTTCSNEPTPFQLEIPSLSDVVTIARLNEFVENYRRQDQNLDLSQFVGLNRLQLQHRIDNNINGAGIPSEHVPIVQSLLECCEHEDVSVQGFLTEKGDLPADERAEAVVFQGQRNFAVVFRGTSEQQSKVLGNSKSKKRAVPLDASFSVSHSASLASDTALDRNAEVYSGFLESFSKIEEECFELVDKLVDENPFCDVVFSGYSFGAAMATLAAARYAMARPMMRVGCLTLASPKVGFSRFKHVVNSLPNLRMMRLELGLNDTKCQGPTVGGWHVGHTLVLNHSNINSNSGGNSNNTGHSNSALSGSSNRNSDSATGTASVSVYKFETPKHKNGFFKTANPGLKKYISTLEDLMTIQKNFNRRTTATTPTTTDGSKKAPSSSSWPKDFANNSGKGVVINNEKRLVV